MTDQFVELLEKMGRLLHAGELLDEERSRMKSEWKPDLMAEILTEKGLEWVMYLWLNQQIGYILKLATLISFSSIEWRKTFAEAIRRHHLMDEKWRLDLLELLLPGATKMDNDREEHAAQMIARALAGFAENGESLQTIIERALWLYPDEAKKIDDRVAQDTEAILRDGSGA